MISITKNEAICRGRGLRKNGQYYFVLLNLHDSNPVNRGKPQCNSEMVQLQRHLNCVFYFRKLCLHSIVYPSQYVLTKQINTKWFSKDKKVFTTQNHYKECTLYLWSFHAAECYTVMYLPQCLSNMIKLHWLTSDLILGKFEKFEFRPEFCNHKLTQKKKLLFARKVKLKI